MSKKKWSFTLISLIIGFMLAVQYETIQNPKVKDTRDEWQLKESLKTEQELQVQLLKEIRRYEQQLEGYEAAFEESKEAVLQSTLQDLKGQAGLTDITGRGITLQLQPLFVGEGLGQMEPTISPQLLQRLINELNTYGATAIQIADERIVITTAIREINGKLSVNNVPLPSFPVEIRVIAKDPQKLYDRMKASAAFDHFAMDNIELTMSKPTDAISVQKYNRPIRTNDIQPVESEGG